MLSNSLEHLVLWLHLISIPYSPSSFTSFPIKPRLYELLLSQLMSYQYIVLVLHLTAVTFSWNFSKTCSISVSFSDSTINLLKAEEIMDKQELLDISHQLNPTSTVTAKEVHHSDKLLWGAQFTDNFQLSYLQDSQQCSSQGHTHLSHRGMLEEDHSCPTQGISNGQNFPCPPPTRC